MKLKITMLRNQLHTAIAICLGLLFCVPAEAQLINPNLLQSPWKANWITTPSSSSNSTTDILQAYGVYKLRKRFDLAVKPSSFVVHVSGDNRYKLFINGSQVAQGPARSNLYYWNFETIDIAPYLKAGTNIVAALVWNDGPQRPIAQISYLTAFIMQGNSAAEEIINTNSSWKITTDSSYHPIPVKVPGYYAAGDAEFVDMNQQITGWEEVAFDDSNWKPARTLGPGLPKKASINASGWMLVPTTLPPMEMTVQRLKTLRRATGVSVPENFPATTTRFTIPANTEASILVDQQELTNAYPTIIFSKGKNASISMAYSEALFNYNNQNLKAAWIQLMPKGNRNDIAGKISVSKTDSVVSNGKALQSYTPLWWRTYRYIEITIYTKDEPLILEDIYGTFTGYPFKQSTAFECTDPELQQILEVGWRTARLCAFETYMDCPYYEQLQYIGDARIQAMVTLYNSYDDRLVRSALDQMDHSRVAEGITLSRYPSNSDQQIPTFSLWWIGMLYDYWMYRPDSDFIKNKLPGERQVLSFFERYQQADGSLKNVPYWVFTDWVMNKKGWNFGMAPVGKNGESAMLDLQLLWTYQLAATMEKKMGLADLAGVYNSRAAKLKQTIQQKYWDKTKLLYSDTEEKDVFSQHTNSLAILTGIITGTDATVLAKKLLTDETLAPASIYFKYYLHQALTKAGLGEEYTTWLDKWRENLKMGLTTWAEVSDVNMARSDCHAWGSSPNIEFYRTVLGIDTDAPGFSKVKIAPHPGSLKNLSGEMPHPEGKISVRYSISDGQLTAVINLPGKLTGRFIWKGKNYVLKTGKNTFTVPA